MRPSVESFESSPHPHILFLKFDVFFPYQHVVMYLHRTEGESLLRFWWFDFSFCHLVLILTFAHVHVHWYETVVSITWGQYCHVLVNGYVDVQGYQYRKLGPIHEFKVWFGFVSKTWLCQQNYPPIDGDAWQWHNESAVCRKMVWRIWKFL